MFRDTLRIVWFVPGSVGWWIYALFCSVVLLMVYIIMQVAATHVFNTMVTLLLTMLLVVAILSSCICVEMFWIHFLITVCWVFAYLVSWLLLLISPLQSLLCTNGRRARILVTMLSPGWPGVSTLTPNPLLMCWRLSYSSTEMMLISLHLRLKNIF